MAFVERDEYANNPEMKFARLISALFYFELRLLLMIKGISMVNCLRENYKLQKMDRSLFLKRMAGVGCCAAMVSTLINTANAETSSLSAGMSFMQGLAPDDKPDELTNTKFERDFVLNWVNDLMDTMDKVLDEDTYIKLIEGCGRGCYDRHQFKKDISVAGQGDLDKLITAYKKNFEVWKDGETVHIRYGEKSPGCYCPVLKNQVYNTKGLHCNCTKASHQAIFENALGRPFKVDILETIRRGGQTCHFLVHL